MGLTLSQKVKLAVCHEKARALCYLIEGDAALKHKAFELSHLLHELQEELDPVPTPATRENFMQLWEARNVRRDLPNNEDNQTSKAD